MVFSGIKNYSISYDAYAFHSSYVAARPYVQLSITIVRYYFLCSGVYCDCLPVFSFLIIRHLICSLSFLSFLLCSFARTFLALRLRYSDFTDLAFLALFSLFKPSSFTCTCIIIIIAIVLYCVSRLSFRISEPITKGIAFIVLDML